jgi:hypothetical protein
MENPDTWRAEWTKVLETLTFSYYLQNGRDGWYPTLGWMFCSSLKGSGIERTLAGKYNQETPYRFRSEDGV